MTDDIVELSERVAAGDAAAQWRLGTMARPRATASSRTASARCAGIEAAARQHHAGAMTRVAYACEFGVGAAVNPAVAATGALVRIESALRGSPPGE